MTDSTLNPRGSSWGVPGLIAIMLLTLAAIAALAYWDQERESAVALEDFAREQATLAAVLADGFEAQRSMDAASMVLLRKPGEHLFTDREQRSYRLDRLAEAFDAHRGWLRLNPEEADSIGLPRRTAVAGLAIGKDGTAVIAVESAQRERDREYRARNRILLAVLTAGALLFSFGGIAVRRQRRQLELAHALEISEARRERDDQLEKLDKAATLGTLAMGIAHEVSTPLGVIAGRAEQLLPRVASDERATRATQAIIEQAEHIHQILRAFLSLARGGRPEVQRIAPSRIVEGARALVEHRFQQAGVSLKSALPAALPEVQGDPLLLEHALVNLLLNACEACARGGEVSIAAKNGGAGVSIEVIDDGVGILPEVAARAAEPFFTTKSSAGGTGLGLAIVNEIVTHHGGKLSIAPGASRGTAARIEIPIAQGGHSDARS